VLRTLRLRFADRPDVDLAFEPTDDDADPWELLRSRADDAGQISLGDRESCRIEEVVDVTVVEPQPVEGPGFERGLQDEDVATALGENYEPPP
jgi:hypothetical protein